MDLKSEGSSVMSNETLIKKKKKWEICICIVLGIITQFLWAVNLVQMKTFRTYFPDTCTDNSIDNSILFWRMFPVSITGYVKCKYNNIHIQTFSELQHIKWFLCRNASGYIYIIA